MVSLFVLKGFMSLSSLILKYLEYVLLVSLLACVSSLSTSVPESLSALLVIVLTFAWMLISSGWLSAPGIRYLMLLVYGSVAVADYSEYSTWRKAVAITVMVLWGVLVIVFSLNRFLKVQFHPEPVFDQGGDNRISWNVCSAIAWFLTGVVVWKNVQTSANEVLGDVVTILSLLLMMWSLMEAWWVCMRPQHTSPMARLMVAPAVLVVLMRHYTVGVGVVLAVREGNAALICGVVFACLTHVWEEYNLYVWFAIPNPDPTKPNPARDSLRKMSSLIVRKGDVQ